MNSTTKLLLFVTGAGALLAGAARLTAQSQPTSEAGLIGRSHAGFDFTYDHYDNSAIGYAFGADAALNQPLNRKLDLALGYDLAHTNNADHGLNHNAVHATLLTHEWTEYGNAYFAGTLGHRWDRLKNFGVLSRDDDAFWALATGYEIPFGAHTAVNAGLSYRNAFRGGKSTLQYRLESNRWLRSDFAVVASVAYNQAAKTPNSLLYTLGVRWAM